MTRVTGQYQLNCTSPADCEQPQPLQQVIVIRAPMKDDDGERAVPRSPASDGDANEVNDAA